MSVDKWSNATRSTATMSLWSQLGFRASPVLELVHDFDVREVNGGRAARRLESAGGPSSRPPPFSPMWRAAFWCNTLAKLKRHLSCSPCHTPGTACTAALARHGSCACATLISAWAGAAQGAPSDGDAAGGPPTSCRKATCATSFARSALPMPQRLCSSWHLGVGARSSVSQTRTASLPCCMPLASLVQSLKPRRA